MGQQASRFGQRVLYGKEENRLTEDEVWLAKVRAAKPIVILAHKFRQFEPNNNIQGQDWRTMNILSAGLGFDVKVINQLYSLFCIADLDQGGSIDVREFVYFFQLEDSRFTRRMFTIFDMDRSGEIDFLEFACAIWNLCTWPEDELASLMFSVYDEGNVGKLDLKVCEDLILDIFERRKIKFGATTLVSSLRRITKAGLYKDEVFVEEEDFLEWAEDHPESYAPLTYQFLLLRAKVLGVEYWNTIGRAAREQTMKDLERLIRQSLGPAGAMDAVKLSLEKAADFRAAELQRKQQQKMWSEDELPGRVREAEKDPHEVQREEDEAALKERLKAMSYLRQARHMRYQEWYKTLSRIEQRSDPLSMLLQLSQRQLTKKLRQEFNEEWTHATKELQRRTYDREGRLRRLLSGKKSKEEVFFMRKSPLDLTEEELRDSVVHYSSTTDKLTWAEQQHEGHKRVKREFRHAGGNPHLSHGVVSVDAILASKARVRTDKSILKLGLEEEMEKKGEKGKDPSKKRSKQGAPKDANNSAGISDDDSEDGGSDQGDSESDDSDEEFLEALQRRRKAVLEGLELKRRGSGKNPSANVLSDSILGRTDHAVDEDDYDTDDEEADREARASAIAAKRLKHLIRQGYANAPASSRRKAKPGQYVMQNLKRPDEEWSAKMQRRAQLLQAGLDPRSGDKPFNLRFRKKRKPNARVYAL